MVAKQMQHDEFWKRMTFVMVAVLVAGVGWMWNQQDGRIEKVEQALDSLRGAISANTTALAALTATLEARE